MLPSIETIGEFEPGSTLRSSRVIHSYTNDMIGGMRRSTGREHAGVAEKHTPGCGIQPEPGDAVILRFYFATQISTRRFFAVPMSLSLQAVGAM
jgi:hypothetical protein